MLNFSRYEGASVLLARHNFGCGSSREHAPWGVKDYGFRVIIAPSYADIFYNNCFKNGILPASLSEEQVEELFQRTEKERLHADCEPAEPNHRRPAWLDVPVRSGAFAQRSTAKGPGRHGYFPWRETNITAYEKAHAATATMYEAVDVKNYGSGR